MAHSEPAELILQEIQRNEEKRWRVADQEWDTFVRYWTDPKNLPAEGTYPYELATKVRLEDVNVLYDTSGDLIVTKGYADMYKCIQTALFLRESNISRGENNSTIRPLPMNPGVILTGQPGTGKSVSLWYLAIRLLQDCSNDPLLVILPTTAFLFYKRCAFQSIRQISYSDDLPSSRIFSKRQLTRGRTMACCLTLVEWTGEVEPMFFQSAELIHIYATSTKARIKNFLKQDHPYVWGYPTWDMNELELGYFKLYNHHQATCDLLKDHPLPVTENEVPCCSLNPDDGSVADEPGNNIRAKLAQLLDLAVREVGWAPRGVYAFMANLGANRAANQATIFSGAGLANVLLMSLIESSDILSSSHSDRIRKFSHKLFTAHARPQSEADLSPTKFAPCFKSSYVAGAFEKRFQLFQWAELKELLRAIRAIEDVPAARAMQGISVAVCELWLLLAQIKKFLFSQNHT